MSGPPPPPPPPGPPPPPAMAPPPLSKTEQHGRSALLTDISKGTRLKSAKHLMNDRSGLPSSVGGNTGKGGGAGACSRPAMPPGCENGRISAGRAPASAGGRAPHPGGGGASGAGTVRNPPPGLGDLFGGGVPKLRGAGSIGRSALASGRDRVSNGSVDNFPPPPPPPPPSSSKPTVDFCDGASATVGRSAGSRMSGGLPPPPSPSQLSRPLPNVPGPRPSGPPPPPTRAPPPSKAHENGPTTQGYNNNRTLPPTPSLPPKPPERKDSVGPPPPPPPFRAANGPPPPPNRGPGHGPLPVRPPGAGRTGPPPGPPPPPGPMKATSAPPPPVRPPIVGVARANSTASAASAFEAMFQFPTDLPPPDPFTASNKTYPSQNPNRRANASTSRRPVPPPPPPGGP